MTMGAGLIAIGALALAAPLATGTWSLQLLSLFPLAVGVANLYTVITAPKLRARPGAYATSALALAAAVLLYVSPSLVVSGVVGILLALLVADGLLKIGEGLLGYSPTETPIVPLANGAASLFLAFLGWLLWRTLGVDAAVGAVIGGYTAATGWAMLLSPSPQHARETGTESPNDLHPDAKLALGANELLASTGRRLAASGPTVRQTELYWLLICGVVLFIIHLSRMQSGQTWLGLVSPLVATLGDVFMAVALGGAVVLPLRLLWRRLTRPIERSAWRMRFSGADSDLNMLPRWIVRQWTDGRYAFAGAVRDARASLPSSATLALRLGLPLAVLMAAVNPIWGFSWYFNTESWASGFYQKITELRVDRWRADMAEAVTAAYEGERDRLFRVAPPGIENGDFSFLVIGDPGEGDASQLSLVERYLDLGRRDEMKFLIISSDVIYPAGAMVDYERNFFMPYKGWKKPIYAIPGNHDWFDALEGFNANFLEPKAARAALQARVTSDLHLTSTNAHRIKTLVKRAEDLRHNYGIDAARQHGPYFEIQTADFALIAIDTGIQRTLDRHQLQWLDEALARSKGKFSMAILGHPKFAGGVDTTFGDPDFSALYEKLETAGVRILMAGDTHAFEHYLPEATSTDLPAHHFVNGGGGSYLSIGGALAWPKTPATPTWEFYPPPDAVRSKLDAETPAWKQPLWQWVKRFGAWPVSVETLSAMFDFNHAPFFQSFVEVRVERSRNRVVLALHGANGPLRWRDMHRSDVPPTSQVRPEDLVEYVFDMGDSKR
jgi:hypothetical protein